MGDLRLIPGTRAGLGEGIPEGTMNDVRDPHLAQSETMWSHPNHNHNGCIKIEMAYACSAESTSDMHEMSKPLLNPH